MKWHLALVALFSLSACSTTTQLSDAATAVEMRCTTVPWVDQGKPIVKVSVNDRELTFVVDTGAEYSGWIRPELARELGLPIVGTVPADGDDPTGGLPFYGVSMFELGSITFTDLHLGELPPLGPNPPPFDGIIGNGLFSQMQLALDYERGVLQVTDLNLVKGEVVPFDKYGIPLITVDIGERPVKVHLDTGNLAGKLYVTAEDAAALRTVGEPVTKGRAMTVSGAFDVMEATLADPVRYGQTILPITAVRWPGAYDEGQLGSAGFAGQTVRVDWRSKRVSIMPENTAPVCP